MPTARHPVRPHEVRPRVKLGTWDASSAGWLRRLPSFGARSAGDDLLGGLAILWCRSRVGLVSHLNSGCTPGGSACAAGRENSSAPLASRTPSRRPGGAAMGAKPHVGGATVLDLQGSAFAIRRPAMRTPALGDLGFTRRTRQVLTARRRLRQRRVRPGRLRSDLCTGAGQSCWRPSVAAWRWADLPGVALDPRRLVGPGTNSASVARNVSGRAISAARAPHRDTRGGGNGCLQRMMGQIQQQLPTPGRAPEPSAPADEDAS